MLLGGMLHCVLHELTFGNVNLKLLVGCKNGRKDGSHKSSPRHNTATPPKTQTPTPTHLS